MLSRIAATVPAALLAVSALVLSKAFVDYSTSGLENPLTHLLLAALFRRLGVAAPASRRRIRLLSLLAALLMLNRLDTGLLVLPTLAVEWRRAGLRRTWRAVAIGMLPLVAWEAFSLIYYGFPFPEHGVLEAGARERRARRSSYQGFLYLLDSIGNDPVTLLIIVGALVSPLAGVRGWTMPARHRPLPRLRRLGRRRLHERPLPDRTVPGLRDAPRAQGPLELDVRWAAGDGARVADGPDGARGRRLSPTLRTDRTSSRRG